jgi:hypothetical protein
MDPEENDRPSPAAAVLGETQASSAHAAAPPKRVPQKKRSRSAWISKRQRTLRAKHEKWALRNERKLLEKRRKAFQDPAARKIQDDLEHVVIAGSFVRRDQQRSHKFQEMMEKQQQQQQQQETAEDGINEKEPLYQHAEDIRIYGDNGMGTGLPFLRGFGMAPWPNNGDGSYKNQDAEWNKEHGDSIPPILFSLARLSHEFPTEAQQDILQNVSARNKTLQSTDISLESPNLVPRAMLLRCWERAVHAASTSMLVTCNANATMNEDLQPLTLNFSNSDEDDDWNRKEQKARANTLSADFEVKCKSLGIEDLSMQLSEDEPTTCPRCTRKFDTLHGLTLHYYGRSIMRSEGESEGGCCAPIVRTRLLEEVDNLLQHHIQTQTDQLLGIILSRHASEMMATEDEDDDKRSQQMATRMRKLCTWKEVRQYLQGALHDALELHPPNVESSTSREVSASPKHPVLETLQTAPGDESVNPLVLNPMVMEVVNRRLIDRYADLP